MQKIKETETTINPSMLSSENFIDYLSKLLNRYLGPKLDQNKLPYISPFHKNKIPKTEIDEYLKRINLYLFNKYDDSEKVTLWVCAIILLTRYRDITDIPLNWYNIYRLIAVSALLACKTVMDESYNNELASRVFGIPLNECNQLEVNFLFSINFSCEITENNYTSFIEYFKNVIISRTPNQKQKNIEFPNFERELEEPRTQGGGSSISSAANILEKTLSVSPQTPLTFSHVSQKNPVSKIFRGPNIQSFKISKPNLSQVPIKPKMTCD